MTPPVQLSVELLERAGAELHKLHSVIKVFGCPIAPADLDRMRAGGLQDRKEDLMRLSANQLTDTGIFARLLQQFIDGVTAGRYTQGQAVELMGRSVGAPVSARVIGTSMSQAPKGALGLRATTGGAAFKATVSHAHDKQLAELIARVLTAHAEGARAGRVPRDAFVAHSQALQRCTRFLDPVLLQRVCRDTVRSCPATASLGMDALRLLSPLADAMEFALQLGALEAAHQLGKEVRAPVAALVTAERARLAAAFGQQGQSVDDALAKLAGLDAADSGGFVPAAPNEPGAIAVPDVLKHAAALSLGVDLRAAGQGGFAGAVYRRVSVVPDASPQASGLLALAALLVAFAPAGVTPSAPIEGHALYKALPAQASPEKGKWPPLKPEEIMLLAERLFGTNAKAADALPGSPTPPQRSPAKLLLTLRGDWVVDNCFVAICDAALKTALAPRKQNLALTAGFLKGLDDKARQALLLGLYQMATGDPDQRSRQIGLYFADEAATVLKPGLTLGPLRVAFAKHWRQVEAKALG